MNYTLNFIKVITQIAVVATSIFIIPAVLHSLVTMNFAHYLGDITSCDYQFGMGFTTVILTIIYVVTLSIEMDERADRKRLGLDHSNKF